MRRTIVSAIAVLASLPQSVAAFEPDRAHFRIRSSNLTGGGHAATLGTAASRT